MICPHCKTFNIEYHFDQEWHSINSGRCLVLFFCERLKEPYPSESVACGNCLFLWRLNRGVGFEMPIMQ